MKSMDLLEVFGYIDDRYILDARKERKNMKSMMHTARAFRAAAAVVALILAGFLVLQTPMGAKAVEVVKDAVSRIIDTLFPPKDEILVLEGMEETVHVEVEGRDPVEESPGFAMYVDPELYCMTEQDGVYYVRPIGDDEYDRDEIREQEAGVLEDLTPEEQEAYIDRRIEELKAFYGAFPPVEIEIREVPDQDWKAYLDTVKTRMAEEWDVCEAYDENAEPAENAFHASLGDQWDSACEDHFFVDNGMGGTFHIISRYFLEATEGHGARFKAMIRTFSVVEIQPAQ